MTKKDQSRPSSFAVASERARGAATQVVPMARNAGLTARQSAEGAVAWATPRVYDARAWAAPRVEHAGLAVRKTIAPAISEKIAPAISDAIVEAAHWLDAPAPPRRRWPGVLAGIAMLAAAGSAIAAALLRRRPDDMDFAGEDASGHGATARDTTVTSPSSSPDEAGGSQPDDKGNGQVPTS
jgi:hypothetical protein